MHFVCSSVAKNATVSPWSHEPNGVIISPSDESSAAGSTPQCIMYCLAALPAEPCLHRCGLLFGSAEHWKVSFACVLDVNSLVIGLLKGETACAAVGAMTASSIASESAWADHAMSRSLPANQQGIPGVEVWRPRGVLV